MMPTVRIRLLPLFLLLAGCEAEQAPPLVANPPPDVVYLEKEEPLAGGLFGKVETLPETPHPHWVWVADFAASSMPDGRAYLYDGDSARLLGMLNTGFSFNALNIPSHYREIYSAETYYARTTRGKRTDVVSIYDPFSMTPVAEIEIPAKRASTIPRLANSALTDDDRFMAVFNLTPAASLSIVDLEKRLFSAEIAIPGCAMVYAAGERGFFSLCGDGSLTLVSITDEGAEAGIEKGDPFFDVHQDPILEAGVRRGDIWYFASVLGRIQEVHVGGKKPVVRPVWWYLDEEKKSANWRIGGFQPMAVHNERGHLYLLMHQGDFFTYENPGKEIWLYDLKTKQRISRIITNSYSVAIAVSQDDEPLLYTISADLSSMDIYDATSGDYLRSVGELGILPSLLQTVPLP